jgi:hypothetical protein
MRNHVLAALTLAPALALAFAWAVEQRFDMPILDALAALVA